MMIFTWLEINS